MRLISLIYVSSATKYFTEAELLTLLELSRAKNTRLGITGLLLYKHGAFMQLLEGEERSVEQLYATIAKDPRHRGCDQIRWEVVQERRFADWSMGFKNLHDADVQQTPGYSEFMNEPLNTASFGSDSARAQRLLLLFRAQT